jgi:hypothetical protein
MAGLGEVRSSRACPARSGPSSVTWRFVGSNPASPGASAVRHALPTLLAFSLPVPFVERSMGLPFFSIRLHLMAPRLYSDTDSSSKTSVEASTLGIADTPL